MPVAALHHYTIRCKGVEVADLVDFYTRVVGLSVGERPALPLPGAWLYAGGEPIVHLYANVDPGAASPPALSTGPLDHIAFRSTDLSGMRAHLRRQAVPFTEAPVPGRPLHQVFLQDPKGIRIELTFWLDDEAPGVV